MTLDKTDVQKFMKRLREHHKNYESFNYLTHKQQKKYNHYNNIPMPDIKYYAVGEYGDIHKRPHYHIILFNTFIPIIQKAWSKGTVWIDEVNANTIAYTLKYIEKKSSPKWHWDEEHKPEFSLYSKGLGKNYITKESKKWHTADNDRNYVTIDNYKIPIPKSFRNEIYTKEQRDKLLGYVKERVELAIQYQEDIDKRFGLNPDVQNAHRKNARNIKNKSTKKIRDYLKGL